MSKPSYNSVKTELDCISRQAVLDLCERFNGGVPYSVLSSRDMLPSVSTEKHCEDAISRQAVKEIINDIRDCISVEGYCAILERMKKLPSVSTEKTGHWIDDNDGHGTSCSKCGKWYPHSYLTKQDIIYCCNCGTKIGVEE